MVTGMQGRAEMPELKILLGGIPLGCDNIGDEAILGCFTSLVRRLAPRAEITVCTAAEEDTAALLGVKTAPLYGFTREHPVSSFGRFVRKFDRYIWCGATGLSDYPAVGAGLLEAAQKQRVECVVWGVGMNSELNPAFFAIAGMRRKLLRAAELLTFGRVPLIDRCEARLDSRMRQRLAAALKGCSLVVVRDPQTAEELRRSGFDSAVVGADSAILQRTGKIPLVDREQVRIGFCVSAQRSIGQRAELLALWNRLTGRENYRLVLIPMNPKTDSALMRGLASGLEHPERAILLNVTRPAEAQAAAASCRVVVSSRLHLLILAANVGTPIIGIDRGSKIANFLAAFGLAPAGSVDDCDFSAVERGVEAYLADGGDAFRRAAEAARDRMLARLAAAEQLLEANLTGGA